MDVVCSTVGLIAFTIIAMLSQNVSSTVYLTLEQAPCYQWYFVASNAFGSGYTSSLGSSLNVLVESRWYGRAWIIDPATADASELNNTAIEPTDVTFII